MAQETKKSPKPKHYPKTEAGASGELSSASGASTPASAESMESPSGGENAGIGDAMPASPGSGQGQQRSSRRPGRGGGEFVRLQTPPSVQPKVAVPSRRGPLTQDLEDELKAVLTDDIDLEKFLVGDASLQVGHQLSEGQRVQATVMKLHEEFVFVSLGGANEGVLSLLQFNKPPAPGDLLEIVVRGYLADEGLYELTIPGSAVDVADWSEIKEGEVVEALVTGANTGGLECKVGSIRGFIPASQVAPYRVENLGDFIGQKVLCVVSEANERRGNLVLSRRSILEREKQEQKAERLAALEVGAAVSGTVRKITDFGAFVDIGGLDGLLHISQLSWDRVQHPSEVLHEGQQVQVRVDKIDPQTGKIGLSYRSLQEHPWTNVQSRFAVGSIHHGKVTRLAEFGAFVRLATGVEGLVHLSELAHHRVPNAASVVKEGQEVEVKVLAIDEDKQRIGLSIKAAQSTPETEQLEDQTEQQPETPARTVPKHRGPLKGGIGSSSSGEQFGLKW
jgi:ribosomal protein S1